MSDGKAYLPFWEGFHVVDLQASPGVVVITLDADPEQALRCGGCQRTGLPVHEYCQRRIRDLPMLGRQVILQISLRRVACPDCGTRMEAVSWLDRHARLTRRLADSVSVCCARLPTAHVAELFGLHWSTVRLLDRRRLEVAVAALPPAEPTRLVMDEFALYKGHRYASVVLDADRTRVLWIGEGRSRAAVRPFFEALGPEGCARIEAVAMDMNTAFDLESAATARTRVWSTTCSTSWPSTVVRSSHGYAWMRPINCVMTHRPDASSNRRTGSCCAIRPI